jgi:hypothetical protein
MTSYSQAALCPGLVGNEVGFAALISVLVEAVSVPVQYKGHESNCQDALPSPPVRTGYQEHPPHLTVGRACFLAGECVLHRRQLHTARRVLARWCAV